MVKLIIVAGQIDCNDSAQGKDFSVTMAESNIAHFRQEQILQEQAAQQALYGLAAVANHASVNARMQRGADYLLTLLEAGKYEEVARLMESPDWGVGARCDMERGGACQRKLSSSLTIYTSK